MAMEVGQACDYPNNLISGAHLIAQVSGSLNNHGVSLFMNGTRQTILAGGDSGSRNMFVGAVLGALEPAGIPGTWKFQTTGFPLLAEQAQAVAKHLQL